MAQFWELISPQGSRVLTCSLTSSYLFMVSSVFNYTDASLRTDWKSFEYKFELILEDVRALVWPLVPVPDLSFFAVN